MADKLKKKPSFFILKRWNSQKSDLNSAVSKSTSAPSTPTTKTPPPLAGSSQALYISNTSPGPKTSNSYNTDQRPRRSSAGGLRDLVQCALCLETLHNPKMLACQHTFCIACLSVYIADLPVIGCPVCRSRFQVTPNFINNLPSNLYIDYLLQLVGANTEAKSPSPPVAAVTPVPQTPQSVPLYAGGTRCTHCQTLCDSTDVTSCQHCNARYLLMRLKSVPSQTGPPRLHRIARASDGGRLVLSDIQPKRADVVLAPTLNSSSFCRVCWSQHLDDMRTQIGSILMQLDSAANRLEHKIEHYKDRCERITEQIKIVADEKINAITEVKESLLRDTEELKKSGDLSALALKTSLDEARDVANRAMTTLEPVKDNEQVKTFVNLHQNALRLLSDVSKWDTERFVFDKENFALEMDSSTPLEAESDDPVQDSTKQNNPLESEESLVLYYRSRSFVPHFVWRKTSRPSGVGISPWNNHLYICGMDSHSVLVVERTQAKVVTRLAFDEMLCPVNIAFMKSLGEIYITDKWKHCVHVFSKDGEYLRTIGQKGSRLGMFRSPEGIATDNANLNIYVVDTGNDRVQVLQPDGKVVDQIGVVTKQQIVHTSEVWNTRAATCTELNAPTSVAVTADRVIVLDSGNRRVKIYNKQDKNKITEFGSLGQRKGQFRQPEVLTVDPMGFILVGDSGNCRVQVFKQNGQLVRVFGGMGSELGKFGWISGIHVTKQLDVIISDTKNHNVNFF